MLKLMTGMVALFLIGRSMTAATGQDCQAFEPVQQEVLQHFHTQLSHYDCSAEQLEKCFSDSLRQTALKEAAQSFWRRRSSSAEWSMLAVQELEPSKWIRGRLVSSTVRMYHSVVPLHRDAATLRLEWEGKGELCITACTTDLAGQHQRVFHHCLSPGGTAERTKEEMAQVLSEMQGKWMTVRLESTSPKTTFSYRLKIE